MLQILWRAVGTVGGGEVLGRWSMLGTWPLHQVYVCETGARAIRARQMIPLEGQPVGHHLITPSGNWPLGCHEAVIDPG